jgi:O-antigen/teichoic acid export membrane protein
MGTIKFTSLAVLASAIGDNIDVLMVKGFLDNYQTGLYAAGARISILLSIIGYSLGTVLSTRVARYQDPAQLRSYLRKAFALAGAITIFSFIITPFTKYLILLTAGSQYLAATDSVQFLLVAAMITAAATPFVSLFYLFEKPSYFAVSGVVQTIVLIAGNLIFIPMLGIIGAGLSRLLVRIVLLLVTLGYSNQMLKKLYRQNLFKFSFSR